MVLNFGFVVLFIWGRRGGGVGLFQRTVRWIMDSERATFKIDKFGSPHEFQEIDHYKSYISIKEPQTPLHNATHYASIPFTCICSHLRPVHFAAEVTENERHK